MMNPFLESSCHIDFDHPDVAAKARELGAGAVDPLDLIRRCFEFVRDEIRHSADFRLDPVTCKASEVLTHGTGFCYAKSHLLAALLRANGIPTALCYQRLSINDDGLAPLCLHGLNAVQLPALGWFRIDARGNKPGIDTRFDPSAESLAYTPQGALEADLPEFFSEPLPAVVSILESSTRYTDVLAALPDVEPQR